MLSNTNNVIPPKPGTPIPYICQDCGEHFSKKKGLLPKLVKCPKCGSKKCVSPVKF
jgi:DNA-directed RNA polymerase subunit RPC12/RpoP